MKPAPGRPLPRRLRRKRGFTLIELMISLVMGLIIALAAVGLARTATTTFYEQARISGVEANVRAASERFRNDLSRISYMSTANVHRDPKVARVPGSFGAPYRIPALQDLQGLRIAPDTTNRTHALQARNTLTPHEVHIAGNLTTDDVYRGQFMASGAGCGGGNGAMIRLSALADPAVRRLFNGETTAARYQEMTQLAFMPGERMNPPITGVEYAVQVMDMRGCFHYMTICAVSQVTTQPQSIMLELAGFGGLGLLTPVDTLGDVCGARVMEEVAVAPVQRVRWRLSPELDARRIDPTLDLTGANKFNLERQVMAADGATAVGPPEIVAEYGVDLKLGLSVDTSPTPPLVANIDLEGTDAEFATWAGPATLTMANVGPQRIRSVRYRLAFRTPFPDRKADLPMSSPPPYISRYCMGPNPCVEWARVRTVMSEVALINQGQAVY